MNDKALFDRLKGGLIVSSQAEGDSPFNSPEGVTMFARAAVQGGALGIRSQGKEKTAMIVKNVPVPVIGLIKSAFDDGFVRITGRYSDIEELLLTGCHIIAIDGTFRQREGLCGPDFIAEVKKRYGCTVMADISTMEDGVACAGAGADCISTTLNGYTPETVKDKSSGPNFELLEGLCSKVRVPVFAEGRVNTPEMAARMISLGAWSVIAGTAITRPQTITQWYVEAIKQTLKA